ncbi:baseplate J/gp47 family protein [Niabella hibiscisoli]|uniref:hypothetical protein n=1 Tax=Niabella hibiscisoli TaxID=1825928 RepID=UPI001F101467|nr:hypothetical protein [Niabella hibiscisoli]MCH5716200.1 hypothetical protein [Niabella hibiscisoli]
MAEKKPYDYILRRDGSSSRQRAKTVLLQPDYFKPDERSLDEIYQFAKNFAASINFYEFESFEQSILTDSIKVADCKDGDWSQFFQSVDSSNLVTGKDLDPHLALYFAFLKLFAHAQDHMNQFTEKHIDFYYNKILGLELKPGIEDNAYVIFELAKNANNVIFEKGSLLDAGKINNIPATYSVNNDVILNKSVVAELKTGVLNNDAIEFAHRTDTADGVSKKLPVGHPYFDAFGLRHIAEAQKQKAKIGFAIASPVLLLKEGNRKITFSISLSGLNADLKKANAINAVELFLTGEKEWLGAYECVLTFGSFQAGRQMLIITYSLSPKDPAVTGYNQAVHKNTFNTSNPLAQVLIDTGRAGNIFLHLKAVRVEDIKIDVDVQNVGSLEMENDLGRIDSKKPFLPFGTTPKKGSGFEISYEELMQKDVSEYQFQVDWLGAPSNFSSHYNLYGGSNSNSSFTANYSAADGNSGTTMLFNATDAATTVKWPASPFIFTWSQWRFKASPIVYKNYHSLFSNPNYIGVLKTQSTVRAASKVKAQNSWALKGFVRFELNRSFMHEVYGRVFAEQAIEQARSKTVSLPNQPYLPTIKQIRLSYKAATQQSFVNNNSFTGFSKKEIQLFHIDLFGQSEQHGFLKSRAQEEMGNDIAIDQAIYLLPQQRTAAFYIGLADLTPGQSVSLLLQLAEGTSNADAEPLTIGWHVLCNNEWRPFTGREVLRNETNSLLQSGIVTLAIPESATLDNTLMDEGFAWIRLSLSGDPGSVCLFEKVLAQAAKSGYYAGEAFAGSGSIEAGSIKKLVKKMADIKQVSQPFSSFGGKPTESNQAFRLRVSERLRHKQRAVNNWDWEHMVLQEFPELYKVKCLNHFNDEDDCCKASHPGSVTLVVVPNVEGRNFYNPLQPKVSTLVRQQIKTFLQPRVSLFTQLFVSNPDYETALLDFKVRFLSAGDFGVYRDQLNSAIKKFLTPGLSTIRKPYTLEERSINQ